MSIVSHISVGTTKEQFPAMLQCYDAIAKELGAKRTMMVAQDGTHLDVKNYNNTNTNSTTPAVENNNLAGVAYGKWYPEVWVQLPDDKTQPATAGNGVHVAFFCSSQAQVDRVYQAAMANGATDNGKPGPRPEYSDKYYGAFFIDPCGNKLEATFFDMGLFNYCVVL